jgi:Family of unknown function (DUF6949)
MQSVVVYTCIIACGFVLAGVLASFVQLVSGQPMRFGVEPESMLASLGGVVLRVFAGPAILMRNAWRGMQIEARPKVWFGRSAAIAALWSLFIGALLIDLVLTLEDQPPKKREPVSFETGSRKRPGWVGDGWGMITGP